MMELSKDVLGLAPYHAGAGSIVNAEALVMLAFSLLGIPQPWIEFFIGAVPVFVLCIWAMSKEE